MNKLSLNFAKFYRYKESGLLMQKREEVISSSLFFFIFQNYCIKKDPFFPYADSLMFPLINQSRYSFFLLSLVSHPFSITYNMLLCELISLFYTLYQVIPFFSSFFKRFFFTDYIFHKEKRHNF